MVNRAGAGPVRPDSAEVLVPVTVTVTVTERTGRWAGGRQGHLNLPRSSSLRSRLSYPKEPEVRCYFRPPDWTHSSQTPMTWTAAPAPP